MSNLPIDPSTESRSYVFRGDRVQLRLVRLDALTADPADAANGDIWYRDDLKKYRVRENGVNLTVTAA